MYEHGTTLPNTPVSQFTRLREPPQCSPQPHDSASDADMPHRVNPSCTLFDSSAVVGLTSTSHRSSNGLQEVFMITYLSCICCSCSFHSKGKKLIRIILFSLFIKSDVFLTLSVQDMSFYFAYLLIYSTTVLNTFIKTAVNGNRIFSLNGSSFGFVSNMNCHL